MSKVHDSLDEMNKALAAYNKRTKRMNIAIIIVSSLVIVANVSFLIIKLIQK